MHFEGRLVLMDVQPADGPQLQMFASQQNLMSLCKRGKSTSSPTPEPSISLILEFESEKCWGWGWGGGTELLKMRDGKCVTLGICVLKCIEIEL